MFTIETKIDPVEIDDSRLQGLPNDADQLIVKAHRIDSRAVVLDWRGHSVTVYAEELRRAIQNATNKP